MISGSFFSISSTSFSSAAVAQFAKSLGHDEDHAKLVELSKGWEKCFDEDLKLLRPRMKDGSFIDNFNPLESWRGFQEGNAYQYTFYVPHDAKGLIGKMGAEAKKIKLGKKAE